MPLNLDLSLTPTEDLVKELSSRYQAAVFSGCDHDDEVSIYLHGSALVCSGLMQNVQNEILWFSIKERLSS